MRVLVTGASGFVGQHLVPALLERGHAVVAVARNYERASALSWFEEVQFFTRDIHADDLDVNEFGKIDAIAHLAWPGLPNYGSVSHFETTLWNDYRFLKKIVASGCKQVLVTGTCFEYGMQNGCLDEDLLAQPSNPYALAKDSLRRFLMSLSQDFPFTLQWARLFYMYGEGQYHKSLIAQLNQALDQGLDEFAMSGGEQLRDFLPVEDVAARLSALIERSEVSGIINICSGSPVSVRSLVERVLNSKGKSIKLRLGVYPYSNFEPMAFWGNSRKIDSIFNSEEVGGGVK